MKTYALIVAAGRSERCDGPTPKQFRFLHGRPLLAWTISRFEAANSIDRIVVVVAEDALIYTGKMVVDPYGFRKVEKIVIGGETRRESVFNGLKSLPVSTGLVAIQDGARPLTLPSDIDRVVEVAAKEKAAMLAAPSTDTVKRVRDGYILNTVDRRTLYLAQTPQVFQYDLIMTAHKEAPEGEDVTDDASLLEARGFKVRVVEPGGTNLKVTTSDDLLLAETMIRREQNG